MDRTPSKIQSGDDPGFPSSLGASPRRSDVERLPLTRISSRPILCFSAESMRVSSALACGGAHQKRWRPSRESQLRASPGNSAASPLGYFEGADLHSPLVSPAVSPQVLAKFPPSLIITATRGSELSSAVYTHTQLVKNGAVAELHVWEGLFHGFFYNPDVPESRDFYDVIVRFFDRSLGKH